MEQPLRKALADAYRILVEAGSPRFRPMTRPEFDSIFSAALHEEFDGEIPAPELDRLIRAAVDHATPAWDARSISYTVDGSQGLLAARNRDGSSYIYAMYIPPGDRGNGLGTAMLRQAIQDSPKGLSLHVSRRNHAARRLYERLGFREYESKDPRAAFMATRQGIGGNEWWG